jgi:hypothetical protein
MSLGPFHIRRFIRLLAVLAVLSLAVAGLAACGGNDDDESPGSSTTAGEARSGTEPEADTATGGTSKRKVRGAPDSGPGPALTGDPEEARQGVAAVDDVYEGFSEAVDAGVAATDVPAGNTLEAAEEIESLTNVCDLMSEGAKQQTIVYAKRSAGLADVDWTCEKATGLLLRRAKQSGGLKKSLRAKIVGVNVEGDRATASVRFGGKGPISSVALVKEDGEWKLAASPSGGGGGE